MNCLVLAQRSLLFLHLSLNKTSLKLLSLKELNDIEIFSELNYTLLKLLIVSSSFTVFTFSTADPIKMHLCKSIPKVVVAYTQSSSTLDCVH